MWHLADRVIAEVNVGGRLVESTLRTCDRSLAYRGIHARKIEQGQENFPNVLPSAPSDLGGQGTFPICPAFEAHASKPVIHHLNRYSSENEPTSITDALSLNSPPRAACLVAAALVSRRCEWIEFEPIRILFSK